MPSLGNSYIAASGIGESPISTRRFNAYKENKGDNMLNASSASIRIGSASPGDIDKIVRQAVVEAVRSEKQLQQIPFPSVGGAATSATTSQLEEALLREREERKQLKSILKSERKQFETLMERFKKLEESKSEIDSAEFRKIDRENKALKQEVEILQGELTQLRHERLVAEQLDEEHSAKMKVYTKDLMATSQKYQEDLKSFVAKNEKLAKEMEVLKAKGKELERQNTHLGSVQDSLNKKLAAKDAEIFELKKELAGKQVGKLGTTTSVNNKNDGLASKVRELESVIKYQKDSIAELENRLAKQQLAAAQTIGATTAVMGGGNIFGHSHSDDAFGILRSSKNVLSSPNRRVSQLTSRGGPVETAFAPIPSSDVSEWLEPLAIAEHVLAGSVS
jgi:uncharacterized coiled-coil protein SlyX